MRGFRESKTSFTVLTSVVLKRAVLSITQQQKVAGDMHPALKGDVVFSFGETTKAVPDIHPVNPWILCAVDDTSSICIWDYERKVKICEFSVNVHEDEKMDAYQMQKLVEKDPQYKGPKVTIPLKSEKLGQIKWVKFFDRESRVWKDTVSRAAVEVDKDTPKDSAITPSFVDSSNPFMGNFIIVAGENRILLLDYMTYKMHDIKVLDAKLQQCMAIYGLSPLVAFGGMLHSPTSKGDNLY